jgi:PII-like signaling protein
MSLPSKGKLLRIFIGESDHWEGRPLYEAIVLEAKKRGLAGATVIKGFMGFGAASRIHTAKLLELSEDLPIVIEIVDAPEKIEAFIPEVDRMMGDGLITIEPAEVLLYRTRKHPR